MIIWWKMVTREDKGDEYEEILLMGNEGIGFEKLGFCEGFRL